ncbi:MAG: hypothetical protein FGM24_09960 [Candidatus Kapabacteria bacterium]|nr:hypothetical protein [Candidatus Kapabacteria bacterium]
MMSTQIQRVSAIVLCCLMAILATFALEPSVVTAGITEPCLTVKIPLEERIRAASAVIYGHVVAQRAVWDDARRSIYTINSVVVSDVWKSSMPLPDTIPVVTEGGDMGTMGRTVIGALQLAIGDVGYMLLEPPRNRDITLLDAGTRSWFRPYAEVQGLLVRGNDGTVRDCWGSTGCDVRTFERRHLGALDHTVRGPHATTSRTTIDYGKPVELIQNAVSISPAACIGGSGQTITISGSGFGDTRGDSYVTFTPDGTSYYGAEYARTFVYERWSDNEIVVEVPPAYSGKVRVATGATTHESSETLRVTSNLAARTINPLTFNTLINTNGQGGLTWAMDPKLHANDTARACIESVMRHFRCKTGMSFTVDPNPASAGYALNDGINAIVFDAPGYELGAGAVAYCDWIWYSCIVGNETFYWVRDADCRLSSKFDWYYGDGPNPAFGMAKLRYVLYHEIGHAHQFGHVSEEGQTMHPVVQALPAENWLRRDVITESEQTAGIFMTSLGREFTFRGCGVQPLLPPANDDCDKDISVDVTEGSSTPTSASPLLRPNPAHDFATLDLGALAGVTTTIFVMDCFGRTMATIAVPHDIASIDIPVAQFAAGAYQIVVLGRGQMLGAMPFVIH